MGSCVDMGFRGLIWKRTLGLGHFFYVLMGHDVRPGLLFYVIGSLFLSLSAWAEALFIAFLGLHQLIRKRIIQKKKTTN
jgi:hypothetical protein